MAVMRNMDPKKCPMPSQEPNVRNKNFNEVALGYTYEMAVNEAKRCLNCPKKPCRSACPVQIDIPAFIERVANEDMEGAYKVLTASSALPAVCGRVCPQETQCEGKCVRGIKGRSASAVWSALWPTGTVSTWRIIPKRRLRTATRSPSLVPVRPA